MDGSTGITLYYQINLRYVQWVLHKYFAFAFSESLLRIILLFYIFFKWFEQFGYLVMPFFLIFTIIILFLIISKFEIRKTEQKKNKA